MRIPQQLDRRRRRRIATLLLCAMALGLAIFAVHWRESKRPTALSPSGSATPTAMQNSAGDHFVRRAGSTLILGGKRFRFAGTNIYWPTITDFGGNQWCTDNEKRCRYATPFEVNDSLIAAQEMGASVVRSNAAVSIGCSVCLQARPGGPGNKTALRHLDYFIKAARDHGIRLVLTLVDYWHYYQGGVHDYVNPKAIAINGVAPTDAEWHAFFYDPQQISNFENHISLVLNRVNSYTGVAYRNDPTILAWEIGNEIDNAPASWLNTIAAYIKSIDPNHLVAFGQTVGRSGGLNVDSLSVPGIDIEDDHFYPPDPTRLQKDAAQAVSHGKVFIVGEFDWTRPRLDTWLNALEADTDVSGDMFWCLMSHTPTYGSWDDGQYGGTYPGTTAVRRAAFQSLRRHAFTMRGLSVPPDSAPGTPLIISIIGNHIAWRGAALAQYYSVQRSITGPTSGYIAICSRCATDAEIPWIDATQPPGTSWYRVQAINRVGQAGALSPVSRVVVDTLTDWNSPILYAHSAGLGINSTNALLFGGDLARAFRPSSKTHEYIIWKLAGMKSFQALTYFWPNEQVSPFSLYTSANGHAWSRAAPAITGGEGNWRAYTYTLANLKGVSFVKMVWNNTTGQAWDPQISKVTLNG